MAYQLRDKEIFTFEYLFRSTFEQYKRDAFEQETALELLEYWKDKAYQIYSMLNGTIDEETTEKDILAIENNYGLYREKISNLDTPHPN